MAKLPPFRLAQRLYKQLVDESAELQQKIVLTAALVTEFGADALSVEPMLRTLHQDALRRSPEQRQQELERWRERLRDNLDTIRDLEALFEQQASDDMDAFGDWIRATYGKKPDKTMATT